MAAHINVGAAAPGPVTPTSDNARRQPGVIAAENRVDDANCASGRDRMRASIKRLIVVAACWGFPASWACWLIERGGLRDA